MDLTKQELGENFLAHVGVKGMRWGKRKAVVSSSDRKTSVDNLAKRDPKSLSNKQLQAANNRLQMEKKYKELKKDHAILSKGQKKVATIVAVGASATALYNLATSPVAKAGYAVIKKALTLKTI